MPRKIAQWLTVLLGVLTVTGAPAQAQLFESDSKPRGREAERSRGVGSSIEASERQSRAGMLYS